MADLLATIFTDKQSIIKLKKKLPYIFKIAEIELSRGGHTGMEVGTLRERAITAFLIYKFGKNRIKLNYPINKAEADLFLEGHENPISIKTKTGKGFSGVKLKWTVDWEKVAEFYKSYVPSTDMLFIQINWDAFGIFAYIPLKIQRTVFENMGREKYLRLPKQGTNPRGVEISTEALKESLQRTSFKIDIEWRVEKDISYDPYKRWIELWAED